MGLQYFKFEQIKGIFPGVTSWMIYNFCLQYMYNYNDCGSSRSQEQACGIGVPGSQWMRGNQKDHIHDRGSRLSPSLE